MPTLKGKLGEWEVEHLHAWKDRSRDIEFRPTPLVGPKTRLATIGSCFASEIAAAMTRLGLNGAMHPTGLFYSTTSIRQELERIFEGRTPDPETCAWQVRGGYVHAFKNHHQVFETRDALMAWSNKLEATADALFKSADVVVMTLGLIEAWRDRTTGIIYREIPHPDVFPSLKPEFVRIGTKEMFDDLVRIREMIQRHTGAKLLVTVSPVPLHSTMTTADVRIANSESKSRIRAVVSEFLDEFPDVHYFHSYEIVTTAERLSDFMLEDGRHVSRPAVDYILREFLRMYGDGIPLPELDLSWLSSPSKVAERPASTNTETARRMLRTLWHQLPGPVRDRIRAIAR